MATFEAPAVARFLQEASHRHPHHLHFPTPDDEEDGDVLVIYYAVVVLLNLLFLVCGCFVTCFYYKEYIKPTADKWARPETIVPQAMRTGDWAFDLFDCFGDCDTCFCAWCCYMCVMSENWYRAGWSQGFLGVQEPKKAFYGGCCLIFCLSQFCGSCVACAFAALRGGISENPSGFGGAIPLNTRFGIQTNFLESCCAWCCCPLCALTQEHRQIMRLVEDPQAVASPVQQTEGCPTQMIMANPNAQLAVPFMHAPMLQGEVVQGAMMQPAYPMQPGQSIAAVQPVADMA